MQNRLLAKNYINEGHDDKLFEAHRFDPSLINCRAFVLHSWMTNIKLKYIYYKCMIYLQDHGKNFYFCITRNVLVFPLGVTSNFLFVCIFFFFLCGCVYDCGGGGSVNLFCGDT